MGNEVADAAGVLVDLRLPLVPLVDSRLIRRPALRKAISRIRLESVSKRNSVSSKMSGSGQKVTVEPWPLALPTRSSGAVGSPRS